MRRMVDDSIDEQVAAIIRELEERKTRQFTSQNSGMIFRQIPSVTGNIPLIASTSYGGEVHIITSVLTPEHSKPVITMPNIEFSPGSFTFQYYRDYSLGYTSIAIYSGSTYVGSLDYWPFYHRSGAANTYTWQTIVYTWANRTASIPFTITMRATDNGTQSFTIRTATL